MTGTNQVRRRDLIAILGAAAAAWPLAARSQKPLPVIAILGSGAADAPSSVGQMRSLEVGLHETGLVRGRDYVFATWWAGSDASRFPVLAAGVMERRPNVVVVATLAAANAVEALTRNTPIVMLGLNDPVGLGLVASLAHPGGNITGVDGMAEPILLKEVELLREAIPAAREITLMINPSNPSHPPMVDKVTRLAHKTGLVVATVSVSAPADLDAAFAQISHRHPDALLVPGDNSLLALADVIIERALAHRVPTIGNYVNGADKSGALISYARDETEEYRSVARLIRKIVDGADPANLPVERPTKFVLTINLNTAKTLNLTIPLSLLVRADKVIE